MKTAILSIAVILGIISDAAAQLTTEQPTVSANSASYESSTLLIDYTIGELAAVTTIGNDDLTFTQGLLQPDKFTVGLDDWDKPWKKMSAWPNPSSGTLFLETSIHEDLSISIFDAAGRLVKLLEVQPIPIATIDVSAFSAGTYTLVVVSKNSNSRMVIPFVRAYQ